MFLDSDDLIEKTFLECAYWTMETNKEILISAKNLKKEFQTGDTSQRIYEDLSLEIYKGDFTVK